MKKTAHIARIATAAITSVILALSPVALSAQETTTSDTIKLQLFEIGSAITGDRLNIDEDFALTNKILVAAPFSVLVPRENGILRLAENAPEGPTGPFLKLSFTTQEKQLVENIRLIPMAIALDTDREKRLEALAGVMATQVYQTAVQGSNGNSRDLVRKTLIGGLPAVEVIGRYQDPKLGLMYLRIIGIPNPKGSAGLLAIANVVASKLELSNPDDFGRTRGGVMLREFRFLTPS